MCYYSSLVQEMSPSSSQREQPQATLDRAQQEEHQEDDVPRSPMVDPVEDRQDPAAYAFNDLQQEEEQDGQEVQDDGNEDDSSASETDDEEELSTEDDTPRSDSGSSSIPLFGPNCDFQAAAEQDGAASNQQKEKVVEQVFQDRAIEVQEEEDESSYEDGTSDDSSPVDSTQDGSVLAVDDPSSYLQEEVIQDQITQEELPVEDVTKVAADSSRTILMTEKTLEPPTFESPSEEEEYLSPEPETVAPPVAVLPPTKERVTNLKYWFEARAKELEPKPVPRFRTGKGGYKSRRGASRLSKRVGVFNPELLSWHEKKHLFERKIGQSRRWSEEIDQAKAKAKARGGGGRGSSSKKF